MKTSFIERILERHYNCDYRIRISNKEARVFFEYKNLDSDLPTEVKLVFEYDCDMEFDYEPNKFNALSEESSILDFIFAASNVQSVSKTNDGNLIPFRIDSQIFCFIRKW